MYKASGEEAPLATQWRGAGGEGGKRILIFGAGKSATCLIDYLITEAGSNGWLVTVADHDLMLAQSKAGHHQHVNAVAVNVEDPTQRNQLIQTAEIVVSLLPPALHFLVAQDCVLFGKNLLTASYTDDAIRSLETGITNKGLLFLCEMGLDPGIDHMSAMQMIHRIKEQGATITSFISHCGGLVAPESDDNPWHYKISWNPRSVVMAGKAGAVYRQNNKIKRVSYEQLFNENRLTAVPGIGSFTWYPNRDSLAYLELYKLENIPTFIRTTLRYPSFCAGWKQLIDLRLTDDSIFYDTDGMTLQTFFKQHFEKMGFTEKNNRQDLDEHVFINQLDWLGRQDNTTLINKGSCSAMNILQFALEKKLALQPNDRDMIVMLHELEYTQEGKKYKVSSHLIVNGDDNLRTAMAKTVGLPLGIATKLILQGKIKETGLCIPVIASIYGPVLEELKQHGISFQETTISI